MLTEDLLPMPREDENAPTLLFVVTFAFGELFEAMYLAMGSSFRTRFALCQPQFSLNRAALPGKSYSYQSLADLLTIIEAEAPHVVCLFSGYLFVRDGIMDTDELEYLIAELQRREIKVITSDPFLGYPTCLPKLDPHNPFEQLLATPFKLAGEIFCGPLFSYLLRMAPRLQGLPHVYRVDPEVNGEVRHLPFFNPFMRGCVTEPQYSSNGHKHRNPGPTTEKYWLFVMAASEYSTQISLWGAQVFHSLLAQKLRETLVEGRKPVLITPRPCIDALAVDSSLSRAVLLENCDYNRYMALLVRAEYAFYWNIFSASIIARLLNRGPTFFFSTGHVADTNRQMFDKGMSRYYANAPLTYLDQTRKLKQQDLARYAVLQEAYLFNPYLENMRYLPAPDEIIRQLLAD